MENCGKAVLSWLNQPVPGICPCGKLILIDFGLNPNENSEQKKLIQGFLEACNHGLVFRIGFHLLLNLLDRVQNS